MILAQVALAPKAIDIVIIASVLLAIIGTLFLAYDLLGRENGPLRWLTLVLTCGLVSALILGIIGMILNRLFKNSFDLIWALRFLVLGGLMGFFTVILVELPPAKTRPPLFSGKASLIGLALGLMFALVIKLLGGPPEAWLPIGVSCAVIVSVWQHITWDPSQAASNANPQDSWKFVDREPPHPKPHVFSRKGFLLGLVLGFLFWFVFFLIASKDFTAALLESVPFALVFGVISGTWQFINWEPPHPKPHLFSRKGFWTGFVAGFVPWHIFLIWQNYAGLQRVSGPVSGFEAMLIIFLILLLAGAFALANAAAGSIAQYTLWRANNLPPRTLGAFGLILILVAFSLQAVEPVIDILNNIK